MEGPSDFSQAARVHLVADAGGQIYEGNAEANNLRLSPILVNLPPPSDLVVSDVQVPALAIPGKPVVVTWTLTNQGGNPAVEKAVQSIIDRRRLEYEKWLFVLGTLGNNAPFIGLFGTVLGIIRAFADLAVANKGGGGTTTASFVMAGISEALVATAVGLFVAIPAVLAFNIFQRLLKRVIGRSNALGNAIASGLHARNGSK